MHTHTDGDDLGDIWYELNDVVVHYYILGLMLHLPVGQVAAIHHNHCHDCRMAFEKILYQWLNMNYNYKRFGCPSWRLIVEAIHTVDCEMAARIARNHQRYAHMHAYC